MVLATLLLTIFFASRSQAQNTCGNAASPPSIISGSVDGALNLQGVEYVAGDSFPLELLTDSCTDIQSIKVGSTVLTPAMDHSGTLPNYYWYSSVDTQNNATVHGYLISVGFPPIADGSTDLFSVTIVRRGGTGTAEFTFPLVHVSHVYPIGADAVIGIAGLEIHNQFASTLRGHFSGPSASAVIGGTQVDYMPNTLAAYIDSTGIWLAFRLKAEATCKPIVSVTGTFLLDTNAPDHPGLSVRWVNPATAQIEATLCTVAGEALLELAHWVTFGLVGESKGLGSVQQQLTDDIMGSLPNTRSINILLDGAATHTDELLINLKVPAPSVEINVPYDAFDMNRTPMRFPPGQKIGIVSNGLGMRDQIAGQSILSTLSSGPNGVPLNTTATPSNTYSVIRSSPLIDDTATVGQLLAKFPTRPIVVGGMSDFKYSAGCGMTVPKTSVATFPEIRFGVNDTAADAQRLRASGATGYKVRIVFGFAGSACSETTRVQVNH